MWNDQNARITGKRVSMDERKERRTEEMQRVSVSRADTSSIIKKKGAGEDTVPSWCTPVSNSETQFV